MRIITQNQGPVAGLIGATIGIASLFGLFAYLGWTADQVGQFGGFAILLVSSIKTLISRAKKGNTSGNSESSGNASGTTR